ncbi:SCO6745 family protein [Nonomuraea rubra]
MVTPEDVVRHTKQTVIIMGAAFGKTDRFRARGEGLGLSRWPFYFGARAGVLGDVDAEVVTAACGFFSPDLVRNAWDTAQAMVPLTSRVEADVEECTHWARTTYGDLPELDQLAALTERVVEAAEPTDRPLFAAWRSLAVADEDPASRVALALLRLREHRGASHLIAIHEHGLTPLRAILAGPGVDKARANGWSEPWPSPPATDPMALAGAEQRTDELAAAPYAALTPEEREHHVRLLGQVHDAYEHGQHPEQA